MSALQPTSQNLPVSMMHGSQMVNEINENKQKNEDKVRMVRQQSNGGAGGGRQRGNAERDLIGKS